MARVSFLPGLRIRRIKPMPNTMATSPSRAYSAWVPGVAGDLAMALRVMIPMEHKSSVRMIIARSTGHNLVIRVENRYVVRGMAAANSSAWVSRGWVFRASSRQAANWNSRTADRSRRVLERISARFSLDTSGAFAMGTSFPGG